MIRPYGFSLPAPPRIFVARPLSWDLWNFGVSAPGKLCINACLYRLNAPGSLPADVPPALIQMKGKRTFAKLAVNLCLVNQCKGPSKCRRALHQQAFYRIPRIVQEQTLWTPKGFVKVQLLRKKVSAVTAEDIMKFLISKDAAGKKKSMYAHALVRPVVSLSVWRRELSIQRYNILCSWQSKIEGCLILSTWYEWRDTVVGWTNASH